MTRHIALVLVMTGAALAAPVVEAHHGTSITYFVDKSITVEGVVTEFVYGYPHPQVYFDVKKADGTVEQWGSEFGPTPLMMRNFKVGWGRDSIKQGDKITLTCAPHKTPGATACLAREMHINGRLVALTAEQAKKVAGGE
jgi:uncharacterized Zn-finger protein